MIMTKVTIWGKPEEASHELKKIEFKIDVDEPRKDINEPAYFWDNVQLLAPNYIDGYDLIACWNSPAHLSRKFYYGHWNDGIV